MDIQKNKPPFVSIIVPVYNVENFLAECLDSVEAQTCQDFEIIAINDGSTDRSSIILEAYAAKDSRIKVINQENAGLSAARNAGLDVAGGEYVLFLDSDDLLTPDALGKLADAAKKNDSDIVIYDYFTLSDATGGLGFYRDQKIYSATNGKTFTIEDEPQMAQFIGVCDRAFKRSFIEENGFRFIEGKLYEDVPFCFQTELHAKKISLISDHIYYYRRNIEGSITSDEMGSKRHRQQFLNVQKLAQEELQKVDASDEVLRYYTRYFMEYSYLHQSRASGRHDFDEFFEQVRQMAHPKLTGLADYVKDPRFIFYKKCLERNDAKAAFFFMKSVNQLRRPIVEVSWRSKLLKSKVKRDVSRDGARLKFPERQPEFVEGFSRDSFINPKDHIGKVLESKSSVNMNESNFDEPIVSVLVPCYNVEKYVGECLNSLLAQDLEQFEAICINDGSTDSTPEIIKSYCEKDHRFKLIDKPNSGYGASMNRGLDEAKGEYVAILESDDMLEPNGLSTLVREAKEHGADAVKSNFFMFWTTPQHIRQKCNVVLPKHPHVANPQEFHELFWFMPSIWSAIYSREFLIENNIRFLETPGASYQDLSFSFKVWANASKVVLLREAFVNYRQDNENSSINSPGKVFCVCDEFEEMERFVDEHPELEFLKKVEVRLKFDSYIWNFKRLSPELRAEFLPHFYEEFLLEEALGNIDYSMFLPWNEVDCRLLLKDPIKFLKQANRLNCKYGSLTQVQRYLKAGGSELLKKRFLYKD